MASSRVRFIKLTENKLLPIKIRPLEIDEDASWFDESHCRDCLELSATFVRSSEFDELLRKSSAGAATGGRSYCGKLIHAVFIVRPSPYPMSVVSPVCVETDVSLFDRRQRQLTDLSYDSWRVAPSFLFATVAPLSEDNRHLKELVIRCTANKELRSSVSSVSLYFPPKRLDGDSGKENEKKRVRLLKPSRHKSAVPKLLKPKLSGKAVASRRDAQNSAKLERVKNIISMFNRAPSSTSESIADDTKDEDDDDDFDVVEPKQFDMVFPPPDVLAAKCRSMESCLEEIFLRKVYCKRHEDYRRGGKSRAGLTYQAHFSKFSDEHLKTVTNTLTELFCSKGLKYFDYVMKVLLPETLVMLLMEYAKLSRDKAEEAISFDSL
ncbi:uncharacterized protein [Oscarella lobularis]|uniref:uncharacterized protein isoform X2 n=1 Tax=Oscarella lobularis TaxID=121494 RepID=UPI00331384B0